MDKQSIILIRTMRFVTSNQLLVQLILQKVGFVMHIVGHRGAGGLAPENSLEAIRKALKHKVDMIEIDARVRAGVVVLSHDAARNNITYCPLKQALKEISGRIPVNIEIKEKRVIKYLPKILENYEGEVLFSSFSYNTLKELQKVLPEAKIAVLEKWSSLRILAFAELLGTKRLHIKETWIWKGLVSSLKRQGYSVYCYTVNTPQRAEELKEWGVDGIFTDFPNRFA